MRFETSQAARKRRPDPVSESGYGSGILRFDGSCGDAAGGEGSTGRLIHDRYRLIAQLSSGGMGITYRAWDTRGGVPVVVKMPRPEVRLNRDSLARFAREIEAMRAVPHESIVPITDSGEDNGCPFVAMRFLPGGSLADYRRWDDEGRPVRNPPGMLHLWLPAVASALDFIHSKGMLHRDVKPGNIFLDGFLHPFLGDFGIAKVVDDSGGLSKDQTITATRMAVGTPEYMAPELFKPRSHVDGRVDQYALAVTVYEMLSGEKPFAGAAAHIIVEHSSLPVPPLEGKCPTVPQSVCKAVHRALAKKPEERFATCGAFAAAVLADLKPLERETATVRLLCPHCRNILKLSRRAANRSGRCPRCQMAMDVAADLGSLWLESEQRGGPAAAEINAGAVDAGPVPERDVSRAWLGLGAVCWAAIGGLVTGFVLGDAGQRESIQVGGERKVHEASGAASETPRRHAEQLRLLQEELDGARRSLEGAESKVKALERQVRFQKQSIAALERSNASLAVRPPPDLPPADFGPTAVADVSEEPAASFAVKLPEVATNTIGMRFRLCMPGKCLMGDVGGGANERPVHEIAITGPFYIAEHEVTNDQWKRVMGGFGKADAHPVNQVSWQEATEYCRRLSALPAEQESRRTYRLPTEGEWEYACRAGSETRYSFGDDESRLGEYAWFSGNSGRQLQAVGQLRENPWGLHDMHGNVWEWVSDPYGNYPRGRMTDALFDAAVTRRVIRGGGCLNSAGSCRSAVRQGLEASIRDADLGFRVAWTAVEDALSESGR